jgi:uncharacterized protein
MTARETVRLPLHPSGHLHGSVALTGESNAVLFVHGFGSNHKGEKVESVRAACSRRDWSFASFDFRGHGESSGTLLDLRGSGLQADLESVRLYLAERGVRRLFLVGSSMGGWASSWFSQSHPEAVPAVVLIAPAFRFLQRRWEEADESTRQTWEQTGRIRLRNKWLDVELGHGLVAERADFDPETLAASWRTPALIFHGMQDESVPWRDTLDLVERAGCHHIELRLLGNGDHRLLEYKEEMAEEVCRFFARWWK